MSCLTRKPTNVHAHEKTQISLDIYLVWSEYLLCPVRVAKGLNNLHANSKHSDQNKRMPRLIWVFARCLSLCFVVWWLILYFSHIITLRGNLLVNNGFGCINIYQQSLSKCQIWEFWYKFTFFLWSASSML